MVRTNLKRTQTQLWSLFDKLQFQEIKPFSGWLLNLVSASTIHFDV